MEQGKLVPKRRFEEFEENWSFMKLQDLLYVNSGRDYKHLKNGDIPVYGTGGLMLFVDDKLSEVDGIGIGRKGTIDKPQYLKAPFWTVDTLFYMTPIHKCDLYFMYSKSQVIDWSKMDESTGVPSLSKNTIEKRSIYLPKYEEQQKIGQFFKHLDEMIALQQKKIDKTNALKSAYLAEMFPAEGERVPKRRFAGFTDEWKMTSLGEIGQTFNGLSGKTKKDFGHGNAEFVTYLNVFNNPISNTNITENVEVDIKQSEVKYGDVLFTTSSETPHEVGMSSVWLDDRPNVYLNSFCFGYRMNISVNYLFIAYLFRARKVRKQMEILAQGISRYNISKNKVMEIKILLPNQKEQQKIGAFFKNLDGMIANHQQKLEKLKATKQAYLNEMFV